jgi:5-methylcytosine-specific restriction protein A
LPVSPQRHRPPGTTPSGRQKDTRRSSAQRGYDHRWRETRAAFLREHPLCQDCLEGVPGSGGPRYTPAEHVHHLQKVADRPELLHEESNLRALCSHCHNRRTARGE